MKREIDAVQPQETSSDTKKLCPDTPSELLCGVVMETVTVEETKGKELDASEQEISTVLEDQGVALLPRIPAIAESTVGITEYVLPDARGFTGVLKQRFSDFIVHEVDSEGNVVHLTDMDYQAPRQKEQEEKESPMSEEQALKQLETLVGSAVVQSFRDTFLQPGDTGSSSFSKNAQVETGPLEEKESRKAVHEFIRKRFQSRFDTQTLEGNRIAIVPLKSKGAQARNNRQKLPAPYCQFVLYKENRDTLDALGILARTLRLPPKVFTFAGTKDKRAITSQTVSAHRVPAEKLADFQKRYPSGGVYIGNFKYSETGVRLGDLSGNRFTIVLRNVQGATKAEITKSLESIRENGFINYFGMQRFGRGDVGTHEIGLAVLRSDWKAVAHLILDPRDGDAYSLDARKCWAEGDYQKAASLMRRSCIAETAMLQQFVKDQKAGRELNYSTAFAQIPRNLRLMYLHAYQSMQWNKMTSERMTRFGHHPIVGDIVLVNKNSKSREWEERNAVKILETEEECKEFCMADIVLPLCGGDTVFPKNEIGDLYRELLGKDGILEVLQQQSRGDLSLSGDYRPVIGKPIDFDWKFQKYDDYEVSLVPTDLERLRGDSVPSENRDGKYLALILDFTLKASHYATMLLRELMKISTSSAHQSTLNTYEET